MPQMVTERKEGVRPVLSDLTLLDPRFYFPDNHVAQPVELRTRYILALSGSRLSGGFPAQRSHRFAVHLRGTNRRIFFSRHTVALCPSPCSSTVVALLREDLCACDSLITR